MDKTMAKAAARRTKAPAPKKDYDADIRAQLEPYGLELSDVVAVLEEDPELLQYVKQGSKGESLARASRRKKESVGYCATGVKKTINNSSATSVGSSNGNDIQLAAQRTGDWFTVTYHAAETPDSLKYAPNGAMLSWDNQDDPKNRKNPNSTKSPGGYLYGHVTIKNGDNSFFSDHPETGDGNVNLVLHKGRNGGPRYGSLSYVSFPKDVTFSPELIQLAQERKRERETEREIPVADISHPTEAVMRKFLSANPRIGYLMLKKVNPTVSFDLSADGGKNIIKYYNALPENSPERVALDMLVSKGIKNPMDYTAVNNIVNEVSDEVLKLSNPMAYERRQPATEKQMQYLCSATPQYVYQLRQNLGLDATSLNSRETREHIQGLSPYSQEARAINALAKKNLRMNTNPVEVKLVVANVAKDYRSATPEEINNLFENTPALVYEIQAEFGTQKQSGIRITSELHEYYNQLPPDSLERKAIDELAMAHIEISEVKTTNLNKAVRNMAYNHKPESLEHPREEIHLECVGENDGLVAMQGLEVEEFPADIVMGVRAPEGKVKKSKKNKIKTPAPASEVEVKAPTVAECPVAYYTQEEKSKVAKEFTRISEQEWQQLTEAYLGNANKDAPVAVVMREDAVQVVSPEQMPSLVDGLATEQTSAGQEARSDLATTLTSDKVASEGMFGSLKTALTTNDDKNLDDSMKLSLNMFTSFMDDVNKDGLGKVPSLGDFMDYLNNNKEQSSALEQGNGQMTVETIALMEMARGR